jgi:hypothetical protein
MRFIVHLTFALESNGLARHQTVLSLNDRQQAQAYYPPAWRAGRARIVLSGCFAKIRDCDGSALSESTAGHRSNAVDSETVTYRAGLRFEELCLPVWEALARGGHLLHAPP